MNVPRATVPLLVASLCWACSDDEPDAPAGAAVTSGPTSSTAAGMGGNGSGGTTGSTTSSSTGSGGSIMMTACNEALCDLTFAGTGFNEWDGTTLVWGLSVQGTTSGDLTYQDAAAVSGGAFSFTANDVLEKGTSYNLGYFLDDDGDGYCVSNGQPVWRLQLAAVQEHYDIVVTYNLDNLTNLGCTGFGAP